MENPDRELAKQGGHEGPDHPGKSLAELIGVGTGLGGFKGAAGFP